MKIAKFIDKQWRDYANYDNFRSLPHIMDGQKITERKILYAFINFIGQDKIVCDKAGMRAADVSNYHHGATSMIGVLIGMNQDYPGANNLPLFEKHGQFGTRLNHKASSERYISTKLNDTYKKLFNPDDNFILEKQFDQGNEIEPKYYLPKLPLLLLNGSRGVGNGYSSLIMSYEIGDVKKAIQEVLKFGKVQNKLTPYIRDYEGGVSKNHDTQQITFEGNLKIQNTTTIIIDELTPSLDLAKYKEILNDLVDRKIIKDYENESTENEWKFIIDCPRTTTAIPLDKLLVMFKLIEKETETVVCWKPDGKLGVYSNVESMLEAWVVYRLDYYQARRLNKIERYDEELIWLTIKRMFIVYWNNKSTELVRMNSKELFSDIKYAVTTNEEYIKRLLAMRISSLTLEEIKELNDQINKIEKDKQTLMNSTKQSLMEYEIKDIKL